MHCLGSLRSLKPGALGELIFARSLGLRSSILRRKTPKSTGNFLKASSGASRGENQEKALQTVTPKAVDATSVERFEKFIPVTRRTLYKMLVEDKGLLSDASEGQMEKVAAALDASYSQKFYSILEEAKFLFDPVDPDKDTYQTTELSRKQVLDNEYLLLQKVEKLLEKANFFEIPRDELLSLLHDRDTSGIIVSVDPSEYELLQMWTRGRELKGRSPFLRFKEFISSSLLPKRSAFFSGKSYMRVFLAIRSRGEKKLHLKIFKDIQMDKLEHLLPRGKIKMSTFDQRLLVSGVVLGVCLPFVKLLPVLSNLELQWVWGGVGLAILAAARAWTGYKNKRNYYLANLATTLYYKTIANNRGVLTLLTDRAQDEAFKEALLAYAFLLSPIKVKGHDTPVYDTEETLKARIEKWLEGQFQLKDFDFDVEDAVSSLDELGILVRRRNGSLTAISVEDALLILPPPSEQWLTLRDSESLDGDMGKDQKEGQKTLLPGWR